MAEALCSTAHEDHCKADFTSLQFTSRTTGHFNFENKQTNKQKN